jgi:hypothetical protein
MTPEERAAYLRQLEADADQIDTAFQGMYKTQIQGLYALSKEEVDSIAPGTTDLKIYAQLISIVERASAQNIAETELVGQIRALGDIGIRIAKLVPSLGRLLG